MCDPTVWNPSIGTFMKIIGLAEEVHAAVEAVIVTLSSCDFTFSRHGVTAPAAGF
jgi:hypothetical protein